MKAIVTGVDDTPYAHGLYFFNILIPEAYPEVPPKIYIENTPKNSRINPNFYPDGTVCLSLLGNWEGRDVSENWNP
jgi:ubiquitin-protein ligase